MARIKIGLFSRHSGLTRLLRDLWGGNFDLSIFERDQQNRMIPEFDGREDVYFSTLHHWDLLDKDGVQETVAVHGPSIIAPLSQRLLDWQFDGSKPLIVYCTNPFIDAMRKRVFSWLDQPWFHTIGSENCYHPDTFCPVEKFIPFSVWPPGYPKYNGSIAKCLIVQKHPLDRLNAIMGEWVNPKPVTPFANLNQIMQDIPFHWSREPNYKRFTKQYADYRVLLYWSNSPYSIVLFEALAAGIPIVALRTPWTGEVDPLSKYLPEGSIYSNLDEARERIRQYLREPAPAPVYYPNYPGFSEICEEWRSTITNIVESHAS